MAAVFLKVLNMSITASWLILAVVLARFLMSKAPKWISCLLWGLVAIRLICPFSFESVFSLIPSGETIPSDIMMESDPHIHSGIQVIDEAMNPVIRESFMPEVVVSVNPLQIYVPIAAVVWILGMMIMAVYALASYLRLKKTVLACLLVGNGVYACDEVKTPFILGMIKPRIYVPSNMEGEILSHVINHETAHLQRHDHWWKPLGYFLLAIHWFNPLCWLAYALLCKDIEMACDEKVIHGLDKEGIVAYSQALLDCSMNRTRIMACPLAFGEVGVKERIKGILSYRKPAFWLILVSVALCIAMATSLLTNPFSRNSLSDKLAVSMDMAIANRHHSERTEGYFVAMDYDVLDVARSQGKTTVYAKVLYEEYGFDGMDVKVESGSYGPVAIAFDISSNDDVSSYDVVEYWEPRDGSYYVDDIRAKFPWSIRNKALDASDSNAMHENCLKAARKYYDINQSQTHEIFGYAYNVKEVLYEDNRSLGKNQIVPAAEYRIGNDQGLYILEDMDQGLWVNAGFFTETELSKDTFDAYFSSDGKGLASELRQNNGQAWRLIISDSSEPMFYDLLLQRDGQLFLTYGYYDATEKDDPGSDDTRIHYVVALAKMDKQIDGAKDLQGLREIYPDYFGLDTSKGLSVYVWQLGPDSYSCGLLPNNSQERALDELMNLKGASIEEMRVILSTYAIAEKDIVIIPWQNPISSFFGEYWVVLEGEDQSMVMKRQEAYIDMIREMLFGNSSSQGIIVPDAFSFALTWGTYGISSYDSETGKLVKTTDATYPEDYVTFYQLTDEEKAIVYNLIKNLDADSYPEEYDPGNGNSVPSMTLILTVHIHGAMKTITAKDISLSYQADNKKGQDFLNVCHYISGMLMTTDEWKALPEYEKFYD